MMKQKTIWTLCAFLTALTALGGAQAARADSYCREYQKTIYVGAEKRSGYGTACLQPDGSWQIVSTNGAVDPFDNFHAEYPDQVLVAPRQPIYFTYGPAYRPVTYYPRVRYYRRPYYDPPVVVYFGNRHNGRYWDRNDWDYRRNRHDDWHDNRHDNRRRARRSLN